MLFINGTSNRSGSGLEVSSGSRRPLRNCHVSSKATRVLRLLASNSSVDESPPLSRFRTTSDHDTGGMVVPRNGGLHLCELWRLVSAITDNDVSKITLTRARRAKRRCDAKVRNGISVAATLQGSLCRFSPRAQAQPAYIGLNRSTVSLINIGVSQNCAPAARKEPASGPSVHYRRSHWVRDTINEEQSS
jgi:hypothetical protein